MAGPVTDTVLQDGIAAARLGDKRQARELLTQAVRQNPNSATAWLWLGGVLDTPQARAYCLRQVLTFEPGNVLAQHGLAAIEAAGPAPVMVAQAVPAPEPAPVMVAQAGLAPEPAPAVDQLPPAQPVPMPRLAQVRSRLRQALARPPRPARRLRLARLWSQTRFWQVLVACLGFIAVSMIALLVYTLVTPPAAKSQIASGTGEPLLLAAMPAHQATLRPTFTPWQTGEAYAAAFRELVAPTATATPTLPPPTQTPTPTDTRFPLPPRLATITPTPSVTPTLRPVKPQPTATAVPPAPLPARVWDPRLTALGIRLEPAAPVAGGGYWRLMEARWADEFESGGNHTIYVEVINARGGRALGQPVIFEWSTGSTILPVEDRPPPDWGVNLPMYSALGSYSARVASGPSDKVVGMGMGTIEAPHFNVHTCFYLTFRWIQP